VGPKEREIWEKNFTGREERSGDACLESANGIMNSKKPGYRFDYLGERHREGGKEETCNIGKEENPDKVE